jgi:hypothetical protein
MPSIQVSLPDISDSDLMFDEAETREILLIFWPDSSAKIKAMPVTTDARRLAQALLIAAIDASNQMGYYEVLFRSASRPNATVQRVIRALARHFVQSWWHHTDPHDLQNVRLYQAVVNILAANFRSEFDMVANGMSLRGRRRPVTVSYA